VCILRARRTSSHGRSEKGHPVASQCAGPRTPGVQGVIGTRIINSPSTSRRATSASATRGSQRDRRRPPYQAPTSCPSPGPRKKGGQLAFDTSRIQEQDPGGTAHQRYYSGAACRLAAGRTPGRHPHDVPIVDLLDKSRPREEALLSARSKRWKRSSISARSPGIRRRLDRERPARANDQSNPGLPRIAMKMATVPARPWSMAMLIAHGTR